MKQTSHIIACAALLLSTSFTTVAAEETATIPAVQHENPIPSAMRGKVTFDTICSHCHNASYEESRIGAPGLRGVLERHDVAWLNHWIKGPEAFAKINEAAQDLISSNKFGLAMPTIPAMQDEHKRADIIEYLKTLQ